jgi:hypothetical protein
MYLTIGVHSRSQELFPQPTGRFRFFFFEVSLIFQFTNVGVLSMMCITKLSFVSSTDFLISKIYGYWLGASDLLEFLMESTKLHLTVL